MRGLIALFLVVLCLFLFASQAQATCQWNDNGCYACSSGTQVCYGKDDQTQQVCTVTQACDTTPSTNNAMDSCDCNGQIGDINYNQVSCGASTIQCIGDLPSNGTGRSCHYCAT